ncbi:MAG TPA: hypothetical protein DHV39_02410, partial [Verrucomicrobiales bacterium]|nr:hypothetical protein [Verrucomicrobiales bacterium]
AGIGWMANQLSSVLLPLAVAGIIAYLLDPMVAWLEHRKIKRPWAIVSVFALAILLQVGFAATFVPFLVKDTKELVDSVPKYRDSIKKRYEQYSKNHSLEKYLPDSLKNYLPWITRTNTNSAELNDDMTDKVDEMESKTSQATLTASGETPAKAKSIDLNA